MKDPKPENIRGAKSQSRDVKHIIRWDYALIALVALYVLVRFFPPGDGDDDERSP